MGRIRDLEARLDEAETALGASEARYRALFDHAPDSVVEVDAVGVIVEANQTARRRLRHLVPELVGARLSELFVPASADSVAGWFSEVSASVEGEHELADGRSALLRAVPYRGGRGVALVALRDVTERVALRSELASARRLATAGRVAATVAHEVNNPLTVLQLRLDLLSEELGSRGSRAQLAGLRQQLERIGQTMAGLQVVANGVPDARAAVQVDQWVSEAVRIVAPWLPEGSVTVEISGALAVRGDLPALAHALARLLRRAAGEDGRARVAATRRGQGIALVVEGPAQVDPATRELSIPDVVVDDHGGTLEVVQPSGGGVRFVVILPAAPVRDPVGAAGPPRVLVVEDEPLLREVLLEWGRRAGYVMDVVESAECALGRLGEHAYDALLTDERLPGISGRELLTRALQDHPGLGGRAALMTGGVTDSRWPVLRKPFTRARLMEMLGGLVGA